MVKADLYDLAVRNGFYVPTLKSGCCTEDYLINVLTPKDWCLRYEEMRPRPCPRPPQKDILIEKVLKAFDREAVGNVYISQ